MKGKRLVILLSVLACLTVLIVLSSTLFTLQTINVEWLTTKSELTYLKDSQIIENVSKGDSIFLLKKDDVATELEKKFPYLRVVYIETKFPNKIVIHSAERQSMFAIRLSDDEYVVIDAYGKVLKLATSSIFASGELGIKPIKLTFDNCPINPSDYNVGEYIDNEIIMNIVEKVSKSLFESGYTSTTSKGVFKNINVVTMGNSEIYFQTRNGMEIKISKFETYLTEKFLLGLERFNYFQQNGVVSGCIDVWKQGELNQDEYDVSINILTDKIYARYVEK